MARSGTVQTWTESIGRVATGLVADFGRFWTFAANAVSFVPLELATRRGWRRLLPQCFSIGARSVTVVVATGAFVGMVLIVQGWAQFENAGVVDRLGGVVNVTLTAELGPVLAGVMLAGRVGGALTAELGTMNITEQLLALRSMGADPVRFLVTPRFLSCLLLTPLLTGYAILCGALGSWLVFVGVYSGESAAYWSNVADVVQMWDLGTGLTKSLFFGGAIGLISCYKGFHCRAGAEGVGEACTQAFVSSFIVILALDLVLNMILNGVYLVWFGFRPVI